MELRRIAEAKLLYVLNKIGFVIKDIQLSAGFKYTVRNALNGNLVLRGCVFIAKLRRRQALQEAQVQQLSPHQCQTAAIP